MARSCPKNRDRRDEHDPSSPSLLLPGAVVAPRPGVYCHGRRVPRPRVLLSRGSESRHRRLGRRGRPHSRRHGDHRSAATGSTGVLGLALTLGSQPDVGGELTPDLAALFPTPHAHSVRCGWRTVGRRAGRVGQAEWTTIRSGLGLAKANGANRAPSDQIRSAPAWIRTS